MTKLTVLVVSLMVSLVVLMVSLVKTVKMVLKREPLFSNSSKLTKS